MFEWVEERFLPEYSNVDMSTHDIICLHTMVGTIEGVENFFSLGSGVNSHYGVAGDGRIWQWVPTAKKSGAQFNGNHRCISIETEDEGVLFPSWSGTDVPEWTPWQFESLAYLIYKLSELYDIPLSLVSDTLPGRRGIAYHRQGVNPWRVSGGELWSNFTGKVCPGDRRVLQVPLLINRAIQIRNEGGMVTQQEWNSFLARFTVLEQFMTQALDFAAHHGAQVDNGYGHVLSTRKTLAALDIDLRSDLAEKHILLNDIRNAVIPE